MKEKNEMVAFNKMCFDWSFQLDFYPPFKPHLGRKKFALILVCCCQDTGLFQFNFY